MTKADKIRSIRNEELAELFASCMCCEPKEIDCSMYKTVGLDRDCIRCWLDWLKEEVAE